MQLFHLYHRTHFRELMHSEFWLFELSVWLHSFGRSLIAVFIPILLLTIDYSIADVVVFYFLYYLFDVPLNFVARWFVRTIGARNVIVLGTLFSIVFFIILYTLPAQSWFWLTMLALASALYDAFYWVAHIYYFMESSKKRHSSSKDTSIFYIVKMIGGILAPAFGAAVLIFFSDKILIGVSILVLILSILPLLNMRHIIDKPKGKQMTVHDFFKTWRDLRDYVTTALYGIHGVVEGVMWPLFIYLAFETFESVAIVPIIVSVTTIIFTFFAGHIKKRAQTKSIVVAALAIAIIWVLRLLLSSTIFFYASIFLVGLFSVFIIIPTDSRLYELGEHSDALTASTFRNAAAMSSKLLLFSVLVMLVNVFQVSFIIAATAMAVLIIPLSLVSANAKLSHQRS